MTSLKHLESLFESTPLAIERINLLWPVNDHVNPRLFGTKTRIVGYRGA